MQHLQIVRVGAMSTPHGVFNMYIILYIHTYMYVTSIFNSCAHPIGLIVARPGNLPGTFPDLPGLQLFDMPGNGTRNGS